MSKTIVMIHGMWSKASFWDNYKSYFEKRGYRCITPTLRFHDMDPGDEPDPALGTVSLQDYADDIEQEIKKLDEEPIIMGHSMGGIITQILGGRGLGKALIMLCPSAPAGVNALNYYSLKTFFGIMWKWGYWRKPFRLSFDKCHYSMFAVMPKEQRKKFYNELIYESGRALWEIGFWLLDRKHASRIDEKKVTVPVMVVAGSKDKMNPPSVMKKIAKKYKTVSTYKEFPNQSHWFILEPGWDSVADYLEGWLENVAIENFYAS
ncbi:MAG: alpha/beta hydrolase [Desulfobacterales bacterium]|nr:alpha/beta hydrolase [Desulfobacterales bacterium]MCP4161513.1 alpha/beta hydrolase [Deltaproteobacteria bacterium]